MPGIARPILIRSSALLRHLSNKPRKSTHTPIRIANPTQFGMWAKKEWADGIIADYTFFKACKAFAEVFVSAKIDFGPSA